MSGQDNAYLDRLRRQHYGQLLKADIMKREEERLVDSHNKSIEKQRIVLAAAAERQHLLQRKYDQINYEKDLQMQNSLLFRQKQAQLADQRKAGSPSFDHPFAILADGEDQRKLKLREKLKVQNAANELQKQSLKQRHEAQLKQEVLAREAFQKHVVDDFRKRDQRYQLIKLMHSERSAVQSTQLEKMEKKTRLDYLSYLKDQVENKKLKETSQKIANLHSESSQSNYSPAALGKLQYSSDRKKQIEVIDKRFGFDPSQAALYQVSTTRDSVFKDSSQRLLQRSEPKLKARTEQSQIYDSATAAAVQTRLRLPLVNLGRSAEYKTREKVQQKSPRTQPPLYEKASEHVSNSKAANMSKAPKSYKAYNVITGSPVIYTSSVGT